MPLHMYNYIHNFTYFHSFYFLKSKHYQSQAACNTYRRQCSPRCCT